MKSQAQLPIRVKQELNKFFSRRKEVKSVVLFGSRARGDAERRSDIDLSVSAPGATTRQWLEIYFFLKEEFPSLLPINVVRWEEAPRRLKRSIKVEGKALYVQH